MHHILSEIADGSVDFNSINSLIYILSFCGGIVTSISPCSIGLLPVIISFVIGKNEEKKVNHWQSSIQIFSFIIGLSFTMTTLGIFCALTGKVFGTQAGPYWALIMASLILIFGLQLLELIELPIPVIVKVLPQNKKNNLFFYPALIGVLFAFATTPCSTPVLAGILAYASLKANILNAALLLFLFSLGQGFILLIAGLFTSLFKEILKLNKISAVLIKISGIILILSSLYIYLKVFGVLA